MEPNYNALRMSELRVLSNECGLQGYSRLRKDELIAFLSIRMETNYNDLRLVKLRALVKEHGLQGYHRLKKAELIAYLKIRPRNGVTSQQHQLVLTKNLEV